MPEPTKRDAELLTTLMGVFVSGPVRDARRWWRTLSEDMTFEEFEQKFPRGSEGWEYFSTMAVFWETAGSLMRRGLLNEDLAFDTFMDAPPWPKAQRIILGRREREKAPAEGENFEWIAKRARAWVERREAQIRRATAKTQSRGK